LPTLDPTANYLYFLDTPGTAWAWEYLRRNPEYRHDWELRAKSRRRAAARPAGARPRRPKDRAAPWGLLFLVDPDLNSLETVCQPTSGWGPLAT
jgi:hypothetical protein